MNPFIVFYLVCTVMCFLADVLGGLIVGYKPRPFLSLMLATLWPITYPFAMLASAVIISRMTKAKEREESCKVPM